MNANINSNIETIQSEVRSQINTYKHALDRQILTFITTQNLILN